MPDGFKHALVTSLPKKLDQILFYKTFMPVSKLALSVQED